jgi:cytochrome b
MQSVRVKVWDPLVRVFHWSVVGCVAAAWITADDFRSTHEWFGYAVVALVAVRVLWGAAGSRFARFSQFVRRPAAVWAYGRGVLAGDAPRYVGHNPLGGWMVLALMLTLLAIGASGWMMTLDAFFGDEWLEELHEALANALLVLVVLHVAGVAFSSRKHAENLVRAMVTGTKRAAAPCDVD